MMEGFCLETPKRGAHGWLSRLSVGLLISAQVIISGVMRLSLCWASHSGGSAQDFTKRGGYLSRNCCLYVNKDKYIASNDHSNNNYKMLTILNYFQMLTH